MIAKIGPMTLRPTIAPALALGLLALAGASSPAQDDPPKAEELLSKYIEATGGAEAYKALSSRKATGTIEFAGAGLKGSLELMQQAPDKMKTVLELEGVGTFVQGTDGTTAYEINPISGERTLEGAEKAAFLREAAFYADLDWQDYYTKAETTGTEEVEGSTCFVVEMTPKEGAPETRYFDADSGLLVKTKRVVQTPMGEIPVESFLGDYKEVDGITMPFSSTEKLVGQEVKTTIEAVEHGVDFPEGTFAVPDSLQK
ncbi:LolA-like protein [Tautonia plasticadhaerens]|uniref:Outer membrane lipoprotein-sorting protein n=1 Tax=Tautonia plasticadhaerens TaxID=2527974 RepID=A0A518H2H4_9BACT|nr:hypothetical protein [Tautonia plasticadhaerens]QDV35020.1 hypothetical protein ElP_29170 [Tautonia plasticadhaerens]